MKKKEQQPHMNLRADLRRVESRQQDAYAELNRRLDALEASALAHDHALEMMGKAKGEGINFYEASTDCMVWKIGRFGSREEAKRSRHSMNSLILSGTELSLLADNLDEEMHAAGLYRKGKQ